MLYLGSIVSPIIVGWMMDRYGRRRTLLLCSGLAVAHWMILAFCHNVRYVYIARFLGGMWGGTSYTITPIYLCEIAEPKVRGALNTMFTLMVYLGIMFEYLIGPYVSYTKLIHVSSAVPIIFIIFLFCIPESPYFYLMHKNRSSAEKALKWLRCRDCVEDELQNIENAVLSNIQNKGSIRDLIGNRGNRSALAMTETLAVLQRLSGSSVFMAYIATTLTDTEYLTTNTCAIIMCGIWVIFGAWSTVFIDKVGRRPLLTISSSGCALATGSLTVWFYLESQTTINLQHYNWFPFASFICFGFFFPVGLACIPSIIQGELFPPNVKGLASGITSIVVAVVSFITNKLYQTISDHWGTQVNYAIFTLSSLYGVYFSVFVLIETRRKTLEEIHLEMQSANRRRSMSND